jgi:flagellar hook-associated protein 2
MGLSVSGLVGGLDVPTIVSQLMQSESMPQINLQNQLAAVQTEAAGYRAINSKFQALLTAAQAMTSSATWSATTASSTSSAVTATSTPTAQAGSLTFNVQNTAVAQSMISTKPTPWSSTSDAYGLTLPLSVYDANNNLLDTVNPTGTGTGGVVTLGDVVNAINGDSKLGLSAAAIQVSPGQYQLGLTAKSTGTANAFSLSDTTDFKTAATATDAKLWVGDATTGYAVTSSSNTFTGLLPGVTLSVTAPATGVTVSVAADPQSVGDKMKALIDAANSALAQLSAATATGMGADGKSTGRSGSLAGDYNMQNLASRVRSAVSQAVGSLGSPAQAGVQLNSDGTIDFTEDTFVNALKTNPGLVNQLVDTGVPATTTTDPATGITTTTAAVPGLAARLVTLATSASDSVSGTLVGLANGEDTQAKRLQGQIDDWGVRLTARQQQLTTQYSSLQAMLSTLQNQSTWLTGMLGSLTGSSSSSSKSS